MKTLKQVLSERSGNEKVIRAVVRRIGVDSIEDVNAHGIDGGFHGFIYTSDTVALFESHKADILRMVKEMADDMGEGQLEMIGGFRCLGYYEGNRNDRNSGKWTDEEGREAIGRTVYGGKGDDMVMNALAWFAAEEVCRMFED